VTARYLVGDVFDRLAELAFDRCGLFLELVP
jgi:hypothetical protein